MSIELEQTPALVVIDLQAGILGEPTAHPVEQVVARSAELAAAFRANGLPVVLVNVAGTAPAAPTAARRWGASGRRRSPRRPRSSCRSSTGSRATSPSPSARWEPSSRPTSTPS
ncbi:hypothetical protein SRIMM317S_03997 [Streptomyces rimosus subsp. rimosus]